MAAIVPLCLIIGIIITALGLAIYKLDNKNETRCKLKTAGYILDNVSKQDLQFPLIAYEVNDINYTTQYKTGTKTIKYEPKTTVQLRVNPDDHTDIYIEDTGAKSYKQKGKALIIAGLVIIVLSILALIL